MITRGRGEVQQVLHCLLPGSHMKRSWYFHRTQDSFLCYSHRNCTQLYWPVENIIKLCLGIREVIYITPVKRLARPLLFKILIIPRMGIFFCLVFAEVSISTKSSALWYFVALQIS